MALLDRILGTPEPERAYGYDQTINGWNPWFNTPGSLPFDNLIQTMGQTEIKEISTSLPGYMEALRQCPPAFAAQMVRALTVSQARFVFRRKPWTKTDPRKLFGSTELSLLETPWPNGNTADLLSRMEWHAGLAGNAFIVRQPDRLRFLRPDWVAIVYGSNQDPKHAAHALDGVVVGYAYTPGGAFSGGKTTFLLPDEVAHYAPLPDPTLGGIGMSWLTPGIREVQGDIAASDFKLNFFRHGATPNMVVKGLNAPTPAQFQELVDAMEAAHAGVANAYKTLYLGVGADATVVGSSLKEMDFKATQGTGETRLAVLSRVPAVLLGISEGMQGSSLNAGNFGMARRMFADTWVFPTLANMAASLAPLINVPGGAELWTDTTDIPLLREDAQDAAAIINTQAQTIYQLVREGFTAESSVAATVGQDMTLLVHTGLVSVQMQAPGTWHGVQDAPAGPQPANEAAQTGTETTPKTVASTAPPAPRFEFVINNTPPVVQNRYDIDATTHIADGALAIDARIDNNDRDPVVRQIERNEDGEIVRIVEDSAKGRRLVKRIVRNEVGDITGVVEEEQET